MSEDVTVGAADRPRLRSASVGEPHELPRLAAASVRSYVVLPHPLIVAHPTDSYFLPRIQTRSQIGAHMPHVTKVMSA